jgi:uncharacterized membrane protein YhhN
MTDPVFKGVVAAALTLGAVYTFMCPSPPSAVRTLIKTGATGCLALAAWLAGGPWLLVSALALSAVGDLFLAGDPGRWLKAGMGAFFLAHAAYAVLFWQLGAGMALGRPVSITGPLLLTTLGLLYIRRLRPRLGEMRGPVLIYSVIILVMGSLALCLLPEGRLVAAGALMFIASDALLARELFRRPSDPPGSAAASYAVWLLYFLGQTAIMFGVHVARS